LTLGSPYSTLDASTGLRKERTNRWSQEVVTVGLRNFSRFLTSLFSLLALGLLSTPVYASGITINIPHQCGSVSVPATSPLTIVSGWTMSTRGNTQAFANAATGVMTINGQLVTPTKSEVYQPHPDGQRDGNADDAWRVQWSFATTAPAQGQSMIVTFDIALAYPVADHEGGPGQPGILPAGSLFPSPFVCSVTGS
jgi:hypothetical protein